MRLKALPIALVAISLGALAACTQTVDEPSAAHDDALALIVRGCSSLESWAAAPPTTGIVAGIERRVPHVGGAYPACPIVYVDGVAHAPYDAADAMRNDQSCTSPCTPTVNFSSVEWGTLYVPHGSTTPLYGNFCGYDATPSRDPATSVANLRALTAAVHAQVGAVVAAAPPFTIVYTDIHQTPDDLPTVGCFRPKNHGCTTCDGQSNQ